MAVITVTTGSDVIDPADGLLSLREAIALANASPEDDTIVFAPEAGFFIAANSSANRGPLEIRAEGGRLTILGDRDNDGQADVALTGGFSHRFTIAPGADVTIVGVDIILANSQIPPPQGKAADGAAGAQGTVAPPRAPIEHFQDLNRNEVMDPDELERINAYFGQAGADAEPAGRGEDGTRGADGESRAGAILNQGTLRLLRVGFGDNMASGGAGGIGGKGGAGGLAAAGGDGVVGHTLSGFGRPESMSLGEYSVTPYWLWAAPGDAGNGGKGGAGADGGHGGAGGAGGNAAGAILNDTGATLVLTDVAFGGRLVSGRMSGGNKATGGHGGVGGAGGDASAGGAGGDGGDDGYTHNTSSGPVAGGFQTLEAGLHLYSGKAGTGGDGGDGGSGGNAGGSGRGGHAAGAVLNLGTLSGAAAVTVLNSATAGLGAPSGATLPAGGRGGGGGRGGEGGLDYPEAWLLPAGTAYRIDQPDPAQRPQRVRVADGAAGVSGGDGAAGAMGPAGDAAGGILSVGAGTADILSFDTLVYVHPLWTAPVREGGSLAFNVIRIGDASTTVTVNWALEGADGRPATPGDFAPGSALSGTVTFAPVAPGAVFDRAGSPAFPEFRSLATVTVDVLADGIAEAPEGFRVVLSGIGTSNAAIPAGLGTARAAGVISDAEVSIAVFRDGLNLSETPTIYVGPVAHLDYQFLGTEAGEVAVGTPFNDFVNLLGGDDAADGGAGDDVIDGGTGSNFLTGGLGRDVFFLDGRGGTTSWSTITDWEPGEQLSVWGWLPGVSKALWLDSDGAAGFTGVTMHGDLNGDGMIDTSVTWSGLARSALPTPLEFDGLLWFT